LIGADRIIAAVELDIAAQLGYGQIAMQLARIIAHADAIKIIGRTKRCGIRGRDGNALLQIVESGNAAESWQGVDKLSHTRAWDHWYHGRRGRISPGGIHDHHAGNEGVAASRDGNGKADNRSILDLSYSVCGGSRAARRIDRHHRTAAVSNAATQQRKRRDTARYPRQRAVRVIAYAARHVVRLSVGRHEGHGASRLQRDLCASHAGREQERDQKTFGFHRVSFPGRWLGRPSLLEFTLWREFWCGRMPELTGPVEL
jgi:hypothetical protein